ncbi:MAG: fasciclin domain-containing protein, partial [Thermotogota bacterium]|nr:fasciclin domain-containing protein [Thermotogota bacterium]
MKKTMILILFALVSLVAFSQKNIVDIAVESGNFKTLVAAIETAGLTDVLKGSGPFTVFAPTDEAFEKLPAGTIKDLLDNVSKLK